MSMALKVNCSVKRCSVSATLPPPPLHKSATSSAFKEHPWQKELQKASLRLEIPRPIKETFRKLMDTFVDCVFEFTDQTLLPSQKNFGPVDELREAIHIDCIEGEIPNGFPEGVYVRNGPNPLFGGLKTVSSVFGRSSHSWIEGEGMLHCVYFSKDGDGKWSIRYNNKHIETETFKMEKQKNRPSFLPSIEGESAAVLSAMFFNWLRFGKIDKYTSNTNVFEHSGKYYSIAENYIPQEIDIPTLTTLSDWDIAGAWNGAFTSHPKKAPSTGELVIVGVSPIQPFMELGVISADGKKLVHRVDLKLNRCSICHEMGVTERYNVIMDWPLTMNLNRLIRGGPFLKFERGEYMRLGIMPRYGSADEIRWFNVETCSMLHIFNCFEEENDRVVVRGCRALECIIPGPDFGFNKFEWFSKRLKEMRNPSDNDRDKNIATTVVEDARKDEEISLFACGYEWILDMKTGEVNERKLTANNSPMEIPFINADFTGIRNQFGYAHVAHSAASSSSGMVKYGSLAKLHFNSPRIELPQENNDCEDPIEVEYHSFGDNIFCNGASFVPKEDGVEEDDGWLITFVHNEYTDVSQVYIIDAKNITSKPIAKITLPVRVPYGFHGTFIPLL